MTTVEYELCQGARALAGSTGREWTYPWQVSRVMLLRHYDGALGQFFYEPMHDFDKLMLATKVTYLLAQAGADEWMWWGTHVGFKTFASIFHARKGWLQLPSEGERFHGRHSVRVISWDDERDALVFLNSWGVGWGDEGRGYMSREYFNLYADHADIARTALVGPAPSNYGDCAVGDEGWMQKWMAPNHRYVRALERAGVQYARVRYETVSADWDCRVEVLELRRPQPDDRRLAWAHLYHPSGETSVIREFFVAPEARRQGWGQTLERFARARAKEAGSGEVVIEVQEADSDSLSRARAFMDSCGYAFTEPPASVRPILVGTGWRPT